jgi:hypothetical protein
MSTIQTTGEKKVEELFKQLPKTEWRYWIEPNIITKRGSFQPDFVAVNGFKGIFVLEVKDYLELVSFKDDVLRIKRRDGEIVPEKNPLRQVRTNAEQLSDQLVEFSEQLTQIYKGKKKLAIPRFHCVIFPNLSENVLNQAVQAGIWQKGTVLGVESLVSAELFAEALKRVPGAWEFRNGEFVDNYMLDLIEASVNRKLIFTGPSGEIKAIPTNQQRTTIIEPIPSTEQQSLLVEEVIDPETGLIPEGEDIAENTSLRLLRGVAGSGKSLVLTRRAQYILEQKPHYKILVVTFNEDLANDLRERINRDEITTVHFHKLCWDIFTDRQPFSVSAIDNWLRNEKQLEWINQNGFTVEFLAEEFKYRKNLGVFDGDVYLELERKGREAALGKAKRQLINILFERYLQYQFQQRNVIDFEDFAYRAIDQLRRLGNPYYRKFDVVMIDEAQDFAPSWIRVVKLLVKRSGLIFVAEDPTQSIFNQFSWEEKKLHVVGRSRQLRVPFRCTEQITTAAFSLVAADPVLSKASDDTLKPDLNTYRLREGDKPKLICFPTQAAELQFLQDAVNKLLSQGVSSRAIAIIFPESKGLERKFEWAKPLQVYAKSFRNVKGLEFEHVFVVCLDLLDVPMDDETLVAKTRKRVYTMMMRARDYLTLTYTDKLPTVVQPFESHVEQVRL